MNADQARNYANAFVDNTDWTQMDKSLETTFAVIRGAAAGGEREVVLPQGAYFDGPQLKRLKILGYFARQRETESMRCKYQWIISW